MQCYINYIFKKLGKKNENWFFFIGKVHEFVLHVMYLYAAMLEIGLLARNKYPLQQAKKNTKW